MDYLRKFMEVAQLVPLDLSVRGRALLLQPPPKLQPESKVYSTPDSPSPMVATKNVEPLHRMYADDVAYRHMISSAAIPEYNPFLPVLPTFAATQFPQHNYIQPQLQHQPHMQQEHQLHLHQLQLQLHQLHKQKLQPQALYGGIPLDPASMLSGSPAYATTSSPSSTGSNHFPFRGVELSFSRPVHGFGYPYYGRTLDRRVTGGVYGGVDTRGNQRPDFPPPELTTTCTTTTDDHHPREQQQENLDREHYLQQLQLQLHQLHKQNLQPQALYGGIPLDPASMLSGSPAYATTSSPSSTGSNHFPFRGVELSFSRPVHGFGYPYYGRTLDRRVTGGVYGGVDTRGNQRPDFPPPELTTTCTTTTDDHPPQEQQQENLDWEHYLQQLKLQLHQLHNQNLQPKATYGGIQLDAAPMLSGSPAYGATSSTSESESNHFPSNHRSDSTSPKLTTTCTTNTDNHHHQQQQQLGIDTSGNHRSDCPPPELTTTCTATTNDHQPQLQQLQMDLDQEHRHRIEKSMMDDMGVADPEEVAAIYRQPEFLWFRYRYMENLGPLRNFESKRWFRNNHNHASSSSCNNIDDEHGLTPVQQQYDQKRQKKNEAAKRSRDAKRKKYVENQISVKYLTKKLSEMKDIKSRMLKEINDLLSE